MECVQAYTHVNTARTQLEQRQIRFELDLHEDDHMAKLPVLQARLKGLANAARNASCPESVELWEGNEKETIIVWLRLFVKHRSTQNKTQQRREMESPEVFPIWN